MKTTDVKESTQGYHYRVNITVKGFCEETKKTIDKDISVDYYAGSQEPDTDKVIRKALRIAGGKV